MFNDWLILKLTWRYVHRAQQRLHHLTSLTWLQETGTNPLWKKCGLKTDIFPVVYESGTAVASVTEEAAALTGLAAGTPVVAGGGDAQLGCIGVGLVSPGQGAVFGGSFWQFEYNTPIAKTDADRRVRVNCHARLDLWQYEALAFIRA